MSFCGASSADDAQWKVSSILALSRNGRPFSTLSVLEKELAQKLPSFPGLADLIGSASSDSDGLPTTATLILDGEVCILRPPEQASLSAIKQLDASLAQTGEDITEQTMIEDFSAVVGLIKRHNFTIHEPAFFPFDLLTLQEFTQWRASTTRTFSQRLQTLESLVTFFQADARRHRKPDIIRKLSQHLVSSTDQVERMLATASQRGWEGLVLRQDNAVRGQAQQGDPQVQGVEGCRVYRPFHHRRHDAVADRWTIRRARGDGDYTD